MLSASAATGAPVSVIDEVAMLDGRKSTDTTSQPCSMNLCTTASPS